MDNGASSYRRFLDGDDNGFVEIVRDYKDGLILFLDSIVRNLSVAEELTEDTFVKLGIKKPHFSGKSSFKTWLYAIGRNVAVDYIRKESKRSEISIDECMDLTVEFWVFSLTNNDLKGSQPAGDAAELTVTN